MKKYGKIVRALVLASMCMMALPCMQAAAQVTLVDTGDAIQGSILCSESEGEDLIQIMNRVGYDFQIVGNHDQVVIG